MPMVASCDAVTPDVTATSVAVETCGGVIVAICGRWVTVAAAVTAVWSVLWACCLKIHGTIQKTYSHST